MEALFEDGTIQMIDGRSIYCRTVSHERTQLENALLAYYGVSATTHCCFVFPSGMSAISTLLHAFAQPSLPIVLGEELYCDTPRVAQHLVEMGRASQVVVGLKNLKGEGVVFVETCSNPTGIVPDMQAIASAKKRSKKMMRIVLDNTWLSGASYNPFHSEHGECVDVVVESMSKYLSGGAHIAGMCIVRRGELSDAVYNHIRLHGLHVSPAACTLLTMALASTPQRIQSAEQNTQNALQRLKKEFSGGALEVVYPPEQKQWKHMPCVFVVRVPFPHPTLGKSKTAVMKELQKVCAKVGLPWETSFGSSHSRLDCWPEIIDKKFVQLRFAVGYEKDAQNSIVEFIKSI